MGDRYPSDWNSRRKKVYKRDSYRCQKCGSLGGKRGNTELHAHHKKPISKGGSHRYRNLKTVCKSCHQNIHGHGVGGKSPSTSGSSNGYDDDAEALIGVVLAACTIFCFHLRSCRTSSSRRSNSHWEYSVDYVAMNENPDNGDVSYDYNPGLPLNIEYELADSVISQRDDMHLRVKITNPSENDLRGDLTVNARTNYVLHGELSEIHFDLAPGESKVAEISILGGRFIADSGLDPRTVTFDAEAQIFNSQYDEMATHRQTEEMMLEVRKPFFSRLGVYWLILLLLAGLYGSYKYGERDQNL